MKKAKYIQFPLFLLRNIHVNKVDVINRIICYGIYNYSKVFFVHPKDVARQIIYDLYRGELSVQIKKYLDEIDTDWIGKDDDYNGFTGEEFIPEDEIKELIEIFENDKDFYLLAQQHYQIHLAYQSLNITGDKVNSINVAKKIEIETKAGEVMPMVKASLLFEYRDTDKTEFHLTAFCAFIAIKSIVGQKDYVKTNKKHIVARAFGYASINHLPKKQTELLKKYTIRYHIDKLIQELELNWNVITYSNNMRGFYISMNDKMSIDKLALIAEQSKQKNKINDLKAKKQAAKKQALEQIKTATSTAEVQQQVQQEYSTLNNIFN